MSNYLDEIKKANDIKKIDPSRYDELAAEIRQFILDSVSHSGGHLASNLGAVELTIALHALLDLPKDKIVWDVGHQCYTHKILTGRKDDFATLRNYEGLSGFPKRRESDCDCFDTGHSSTSISAALGIASANKIDGKKDKVVAVIGDGALTGGMAMEALNNVAALDRNFVIILNDNDMSISKNVGGMSNYLSKFRVGSKYNGFKEAIAKVLGRIPKIGEKIVRRMKRTKDHFKNLVIPGGGFFDDLGITYVGPIDGHDIEGMMTIFEKTFEIDHPILIHVKTKKGHGYEHAENDPSIYHGVSPFDVKDGVKKSDAVTSYTDYFAEKIVEMAEEDKNIVAITAAMPDGTGLSKFAKAYPDRFFDVGIAEEHAVTFAAGLALEGKKPFVCIYSSFFQRAYDQILQDVCLQDLPVKLLFDRAGLVGQDGETHQGIFDIAYLSSMPNMTIIAPNSDQELMDAIDYAKDFARPIAIRYSRGAAYHTDFKEKFEYGKSVVVHKGEDVCVIAVGNIYEEASKARLKFKEEGKRITLVNARFIKPLDTEMIKDMASKHKAIIVVEEGIKRGGYGEAVEIFIQENNLDVKVETIAIEDKFIEHGKVDQLRSQIGISSDDIVSKVKKYL